MAALTVIGPVSASPRSLSTQTIAPLSLVDSPGTNVLHGKMANIYR
jgi:hypothetical protein